jgi:membrane protease subunit HflK
MPGSFSNSWFGWAALGVVAAWLISTSIHVLDQGERGILTTFGRYEATLGPGLNVSMPWPVQAVKRVEVGKELVTLLPDKETETLMLTRDGQLIDVRLQVRWRIGDPRRYTYALADGPAALQRLADSTIRSAVAEFTFDELRGGKRRAELHQRVQTRLQRVLDAWGSGVSVAGVEVTGTNIPAKLADTAKQIDKANEEARKEHESAMSYANDRRQKAEVEGAAFDKAYALYKAAPDVTRSRIYYETIEKVLKNNQVVLGGSGGGITLPQPPAAKSAAGQPGGR